MAKAKDNFFLPYQARWIKDGSRLKLMEKSRQIGLSWASSYEDVRNTSPREAETDVWISSRDDIQARLYLEDCKAFAELYQIAAEDLGQQVVDPERKISAYVLQFANGKRINSMSSNPNAQAGKRGSRKLDEFALHPDPRMLYAIAYPGITWGGSMSIISTHRGSANYFNELVEEIKHKGNPKGYSLHTVTLQDALDQGFLDKLKAKLPEDDERQEMDEADYFDFIRSGCPDDETFQQEYMCKPQDDNAAFLSYDQIRACEYSPETDWESDLADIKNPLYVGVDIGRKHDLTVIWVLEKIAGAFFTRRRIELKNERFSDQEETLYPILALPMVRRCCIDATGIGMQFAERAQDLFGKYKIESVNFSAQVKEELAYPLRAAFEDLTIRIPSDEFVRADLRAVKKDTTAAGNIRFSADRGKNGHADRFWALALAVHAGRTAGAAAEPPQSFDNARSRAAAARRDRRVVA